MENFLITGISGQDGIFLASKILKSNKNIHLFGITRRPKDELFEKLSYTGLNNFKNLTLVNLDLFNFDKVDRFLKDINPKAIFNLSGPSSVYKSFDKKLQYDKKITGIFDNITNSLISSRNFPNFFQASSSEMFKRDDNNKLNEKSPFSPRSPYASSKLHLHKKVQNLHKKYSWNIVSGIMFNHESEFRKDNYLFSKIVDTCIEIYRKEKSLLEIGSLEYVRDWSYADDVSGCILEITNNFKDSSYVIGSGAGTKISTILQISFDFFELDYQKYIKVNEGLLRKNDPVSIISDPKKLNFDFDIPEFKKIEEIITIMIEYRLKKLRI